MLPKTGLPPILELLHSSIVCGLKPDGIPIHRMQLIFIANKVIGSGVHQMTFQRELENGVDHEEYWENYLSKGSGEYLITKWGYQQAISIFPDLKSSYSPRKKQGCNFSIIGEYISYKFLYRMRYGKSEIYLNNELITPASEACKILKIKCTKGNEYVNLYDFAIDNRFNKIWEG